MRRSRSFTMTGLIASLAICAASGHSFGQTLGGYDPNAPITNFGSSGHTSNQVAYTISLSEDATKSIRHDLR